MKPRLLQLLLSLCLLPLLATEAPLARAQDTNAPLKEYDIQIENGQLLMAPLTSRIDISSLWPSAKGDAFVPATIGNLAKYLQAMCPTINLVLSPGIADTPIGDLKIHSGDMAALMAALFIATDGHAHGGQLPGKNSWSISGESTDNQSRKVEVFNIGGYIKTIGDGKADEQAVREKLDDIQRLTVETLHSLWQNNQITVPSFRFHAGTGLLIVVGTPDGIDVARKIINALPGQQRNVHEDLLDTVTVPAHK